MVYDYKRYFGEIDVLRDITTMPGEAKWRTVAPPREGEHHQIVLYLGCNVFRTSHMIRTITAIFDRLGSITSRWVGPRTVAALCTTSKGIQRPQAAWRTTR